MVPLSLVRPLPAPPPGNSRTRGLLGLIGDQVPVRRHVVHAGEAVYRAGEPFAHLYVLHSGFLKIVSTSPDGRFHVVGLHFRGDWLGFDGIECGHHGCDAVALDTGEVWALHYGTLVQACMCDVRLLVGLHAEMSRALGRGRESLLSLCTLPAAARVAEFLCDWAQSLVGQGQRGDQFVLRMSRAEIGNYLGMSLESVSRSMSALVRARVIRFTGTGRRNVLIPDLDLLCAFIRDDAAQGS
jgi:CRP/FNR family transcriptional regulator